MFYSSIRLLRACVLAVLALMVTGPVLAGQVDTSALRDGQSYDRFLVRFHAKTLEQSDSTARQQVLDLAGKGNGVGIRQLRRLAVGVDVIKTDHKLDRAAAKQLMQRLASHPHVDYVEVDALARASFIPNDTLYNNQWGYSNPIAGINLPAAWDQQASGSGVVVAVIDTGMTPHSDLSPNVIAGYDFISDSAKAGDGDGRDANPNDEGDWVSADQCYFGAPARTSSWHGTHVAGTVAAVTNNNQGVAGVAFDAKVMPLRVLGHCGGYMSDVADAVVWAAGGSVAGVPNNSNPAEVINMSLVAPGSCSITDQTAIDYAVAAGTVVVVAAGNENNDATYYSPASCDHVIAVAAVDDTGTRASFSNYGSLIDVSAPGVNVLSTLNAGTTTQGAENYVAYNGTSMASPHVAGTVALMQGVHANTPATVESILKSTAVPLPVACPNGCGAGIIDAAEAVHEAIAGPMLSIADVAITEGDSGSKLAIFTVKLSRPSESVVTYEIATSAGSATAGTDYVARSIAPRSIAAGQTSQTFEVTINGDTANETDETFMIYVSSVVGAAVTDGVAMGTIVNDDGPTLSIGDVSIAEGDNGSRLATFTVTLSAPWTDAVTYDIATSDGSAIAGSDYVASSLTGQSIAAGQTSQTFSVTLNGDTTLEPNETFVVDVSNVVGAVVADGHAVGTILNDDAPALSIGNVYISEGNSGTKEAIFFVTLSGPTSVPVTFDIATADGSTTAGSDYVGVSLSGQTIPAGQVSQIFTVLLNGDTAVEADEYFVVNVSNVVGATVLDGQGRGQINNDDFPTLSIADVSVVEGNSGSKTATFTLTLSEPAPFTVSYYASTADGSATSSSDYVARYSSYQTISPGQTSATFSVTINGDTAIEADETFYVSVSPMAGVPMPDRTAIGTIVNDDVPTTLSIADVSVTEGNGGTKLATFTVLLSQVPTAPVTFDIATADGTAIAGSDYVASSLSGQSIAGTTSKTFSVTLNGDTAIEPNETFLVSVSNVAGATVVDGQAVGTILNDDTALSIGDVSVTEGNSGTQVATFTVTLSQASASATTFNFSTADGTATAGTDYVANSVSGLTIAAGQTSKTFGVTINGDTAIEASETFLVNVSNVVGATVVDGQAVGTIVNDDVPMLSIGDVSVTEGNSGTQLATFTVTLSAASLSPVSFDVGTANGTATAGSDYVASSLSGLSIAAGLTSKTFTVTINGDTAVEANETFLANVGNVVGATVLDGQAVATILNDDLPLLSIGDVSITEGNSGNQLATFTVTLSQASAFVTTFDLATANGTATGGIDYAASSSIGDSIAAGQTSKTFSVAVNGDTAVEANETFLVNVSNAAGATVLDGQAVGTILNDDLPALSIGDVALTEGNSGTQVATFTVTLSQASTSATTFDIGTANGTATAGTDYVAASLGGQSIAAGLTSKTFSVTINGDTAIEANETFLVNVSNVVGATVLDGQALGTILDDDAPTLSIADVAMVEGNSGKANVATFTVKLSKAATSAVTFNIGTANGTATAGTDYVASSLTGQSIAAGTTSKTFAVTLKADRVVEPNETFLVNVTNVVGVAVLDGQAVGTILNDD